MRISPQNIKTAICASCGCETCDSKETIHSTMYRIKSVSGNGISYIEASVDIPQCRNCAKKTKSAIVAPLFLFIVLTCITLYSTFFTDNLSFFNFLLCELYISIVCLIGWVASGLTIPMTYGLSGTGDYEPIAIMKKYGWQETQPQSVSEFTSEYTDDDNNNMLKEITDNTDCKLYVY